MSSPSGSGKQNTSFRPWSSSEELKEGIDFVIDELGRLVFTKEYHLKRGYCCGNGCIHCPYRAADDSKST